ncbi:hypothetical protein WLQ65_03860 [Pseudoalteromonas piscicida]|uniref:hypothetical protein n=1 Tax=Pseudoalteromonas piscicida TaxID=43662 RepID=UPI0030C9FC84
MSVAISLKSRLKCCGAIEAPIIELKRVTEQMIQKLKGRLGKTIFTYWVFWAFILIPIILSLILMCAIATGDALEFTKITKESLDTFIEYQKVPLVILGLSIPFGTLAAANFRAKQFHRNLERQEYEHQIDLYHKELSFFEKKFEGFFKVDDIRYVRTTHGAMVFSKSRKYPQKGELFEPKPIYEKGQMIAEIINPMLGDLLEVLNVYETVNDVNAELSMRYSLHVDELEDVCTCAEIRLLIFMVRYHKVLIDVSNKLGIKAVGYDSIVSEYFRFVKEASTLAVVVYRRGINEMFPQYFEFLAAYDEVMRMCCELEESDLRIETIEKHYKLI